MTPRLQLEDLANQQLLRGITSTENPEKNLRVLRDGEELWNFASNDYLGLATHAALEHAFIEGIRRYGTGSTSSRLVTGSSPSHRELEETIASVKHTEAALSFSSGYATALSAIPVIAGKGDFVILDKLAHACLIDAARMSEATLRVFPHNDSTKLGSILKTLRGKHPDARLLVVTESVFSMDGDLCPLLDILDLCEAHEAQLLLDEAHALGILGPSGMGLAEHLGVQDRVQFQMGTLGKALGLSGGYLAASRDWIDLMVNRARPFIYTTAPPPALAHAACEALRLVRSAEGAQLRDRLFENIARFNTEHPSAILPVILGGSQAALEKSEQLKQQGFLIPAIRYPTVPRNKARLRITLSATHPPEAVQALAASLALLD